MILSKSNYSAAAMRANLAAVLLLFSTTLFAGDFAVSPMMIDLQAVERSSYEFSFNIFGKSDTNIKLELFDMSQLETGYMGFTKSEASDLNNMASWVELEESSLRVRDGDTIAVNGIINVPPKAAGTYLVGVMVEEDIPEEQQSGIAVKIRYAVILNMRVEGSANRRIKTSFEELVVVQQDNETYLQGYFTNESSVDDWLSSQVQIRSSDNRLQERVDLKSESAWQRGDAASRVFPGAKVRVYGKLSEPFATNDYNLLVRNRFADKAQPVYRDTVRLVNAEVSDEKNEQKEGESILALELSESAISVAIKPNNTSLSSFFVTNNSNETISLDLSKEIDGLESKGVKDFQFYPPQLELSAGQKSRLVLKQNHLPEMNYGNPTFKAEYKNSKSEVIEFLIPTTGGNVS